MLFPKLAPAITIAAYSSGGKHPTGVGLSHGELRIIAQKGRYTSNPKGNGGGNGVDGPALAWLETQDQPRIWVCDGGVTGLRDNPAPNLTMECVLRCHRSRILLVDSLRELIDATKGGKPGR